MGAQVMNQISPRHTPPMFSRQWEAARDEARDLDKYAPNWDGADADPVPLALIQDTLGLFRHLETLAFPAPDLIYPAADGSVYVEWHHAGGFVQMVNIRPGRTSAILMRPDGTIDTPPSEAPSDAALALGGSPCADGDAFEFALAA